MQLSPFSVLLPGVAKREKMVVIKQRTLKMAFLTHRKYNHTVMYPQNNSAH